jgi:Fur family ferric uptake transcriptional regulator
LYLVVHFAVPEVSIALASSVARHRQSYKPIPQLIEQLNRHLIRFDEGIETAVGLCAAGAGRIGRFTGYAMALDSIEGSLKERGVRLTRQRQILLELIDKTGEHLDAERLFQMAKEKDPKLNRVTVYRTLKMLKVSGLVDELDLMHHGGDQHYYETRLKQEHAHVICLRCGKVEEFFGEPLQRLRKQIESHFGFQVLLARTEVGGYCAHCQTLRAREVEELRMLTLGAAKPAVAARAPRQRARRS